MPSLLDLPCELTQEIITLSLQPPYHWPSIPHNHQVQDHEWISSGSPRRSRRTAPSDEERLISYHKKKPLHSLLLTCREINAAVQDVCKRVPLPWVMGVTITRDCDFLCSWFSIPMAMMRPAPGWRTGELQVEIRFAEDVDGDALENIDRGENGSLGLQFNRLIRMIWRDGPAPQAAPKSVRIPRRGRGGQRKAVGGKAPIKKNYIDTVNVIFLQPPAKGPVSQSMRPIVKQCAMAALRSFGFYDRALRKEDGAAVLDIFAESYSTSQYLFHVGIALLFSINERAVEPTFRPQVTVQGHVNEWALRVEDIVAGLG